MSKSDIYKHYGRIPTCKSCINEIFDAYMKKTDNDRLRSIYYTCRKLDVVFNWSFYNGAIKQIDAKPKGGDYSVFGTYITKVNSLGGVNDIREGFDNSDEVKLEDDEEEDEKEKFEVLSEDDLLELQSLWGKNYDYDDLMKLQRMFEDLVNNYECDNPVQEILFKNAAKTQLNADKALEDNNISSHDKLIKSLSGIFNDANIKPIQHSGAMASDQITFGTLIKKYENEKPIPDPLKEWEENNLIVKYISTWFLGHLSKVMGVQNKYKDLYEEETKKHSVDPNLEDEMSDLDG